MTIAQRNQPEGSEHGLGTLLRMPYQAMVSRGVEPALAAGGFPEIRGAHLPVIQALAVHADGLRSTDLAAYARITKQSMGYLVDHLEANGYVERVPDATDQRAKVVRLTAKGWSASRGIRAAVQEVEREWARRIGDARLADLRRILRELVASLEEERGRR